jgi:DNA-binding transcriptional regulator YdaS (Cro superfamily)
VRGDQKPWPLHEAGVQGVAQVDGRELGIHAAQIAQGGEAVAHVLAREAERLERLGRGGLKRLLVRPSVAGDAVEHRAAHQHHVLTRQG